MDLIVTQGVDLEDPFAEFAIVFEGTDDTHTHTHRLLPLPGTLAMWDR